MASVGVLASGELVHSEISYFRNPRAALFCDVNAFVGCSKFFDRPVNTFLWDIPNALLGVVFFAGMAGVALALHAGSRFRRWLWALMDAAMVGATLFLVAFISISVGVEHALCPWCMTVWAVSIPLVVHTFALTFAGARGSAGRYPVGKAWLVTLVLYAIVIGAVLIAFRDALADLF